MSRHAAGRALAAVDSPLQSSVPQRDVRRVLVPDAAIADALHASTSSNDADVAATKEPCIPRALIRVRMRLRVPS